MDQQLRIRTIGIILAGLVALLALMVVAMSPSAVGDEDRTITLEQDTAYSDEGIRLKITVYEDQGQDYDGPDEIGITHREYRYTGTFLTPSLEEI